MAGVYWRLNTGPVTGGMPFLIHALGPALLIHDLHIAIKGTDPTATPIRFQILIGDGLGSNNGTLLTTVKLDEGDPETLSVRGFQGITLPFFPSYTFHEFFLNTRGGNLARMFPDLFPIFLPGSGIGRLAVLTDGFSNDYLIGCGGEE